MRGASFAAFVVSVGVVGCASIGGPAAPAAKAAPPAPAKNEVVVIGRGPEPMPGMKPQDEGTEFMMIHRIPYRCTKVRKSAANPRGVENCRAIQNGESRDPDPGRVERSQTQGTWK